MLDCRIQVFAHSNAVEHPIIVQNEFMGIVIFPDLQNATIAKISLPYTNMIKKLLITVVVSFAASGGLLAGLPLGNDANRHFYKDQEWLWNAQEQPAQPAQQSATQTFTSAPPTIGPETRPMFPLRRPTVGRPSLCRLIAPSLTWHSRCPRTAPKRTWRSRCRRTAPKLTWHSRCPPIVPKLT